MAIYYLDIYFNSVGMIGSTLLTLHRICILSASLGTKNGLKDHGPVSPGLGKASIFVYLFFERQSWCGMGNDGIKVWSSVTIPKWVSHLN